MKKPNLKLVFTATTIQRKIQDYATKIAQLYQNKDLVIIGVLRGGIYLTTALTQCLSNKMNLKIDFINFQSYEKQTKTTPAILINPNLRVEIRNKHLLILDDIFDTGLTLEALDIFFQKFQPRSIRYAVLIKVCLTTPKPIPTILNRRTVDFLILWNKLHPDNWLMGFGMDLNEHGRHFRNIYSIH